MLELTRGFGIGAQFGGKYFCHDVRVVRLPRHGASCPVAIAVSCSADRQALGEDHRRGRVPRAARDATRRASCRTPPTSTSTADDTGVVRIDLNRPMDEIRAELSRLPVKTRLSLSGPLVVARDIAHAKIKERLDAGEPMPAYLRDHAVYYAGPAKTPEGYASGSFGPTTAGRMDSYVAQFQEAGGSFVMLAKGNRSQQVTDACQRFGGFYLGSIGGPAARLAQDCIKSVEVLEYAELGMEAVWRIEVEDFPAFVVVDDKGNDFFAETSRPVALTIGRGPAGLARRHVRAGDGRAGGRVGPRPAPCRPAGCAPRRWSRSPASRRGPSSRGTTRRHPAPPQGHRPDPAFCLLSARSCSARNPGCSASTPCASGPAATTPSGWASTSSTAGWHGPRCSP